jgi:two-component system OmpR family response regulator
VIGASNRIREFGPDLLVLEVLMPSLAGPKLVEILRRNLDRFPALILFSRLDLVTLSQVARITAADDYIVKDGGYLNLVNRVRYHLETRNEQ